jgi:Tfp pilus assembly protein PilV
VKHSLRTALPLRPRRTVLARGHPQQGLGLLEALIASAVLALGLQGALRLSLQGLQWGQETGERLQAQQLALQSLECHAAGWADCHAVQQVQHPGTLYQVTLTRQATAAPGVERLLATVRWQGVLSASAAAAGAAGAASEAGAGTAGPPGNAEDQEQRLQLWREVATVPRWLGVSSP